MLLLRHVLVYGAGGALDQISRACHVCFKGLEFPTEVREAGACRFAIGSGHPHNVIGARDVGVEMRSQGFQRRFDVRGQAQRLIGRNARSEIVAVFHDRRSRLDQRCAVALSTCSDGKEDIAAERVMHHVGLHVVPDGVGKGMDAIHPRSGHVHADQPDGPHRDRNRD